VSGQDVFYLLGVPTNGGLVGSAVWLEALGVDEYVRRSDLILNIE
jgi:hypothetical protein